MVPKCSRSIYQRWTLTISAKVFAPLPILINGFGKGGFLQLPAHTPGKSRKRAISSASRAEPRRHLRGDTSGATSVPREVASISFPAAAYSRYSERRRFSSRTVTPMTLSLCDYISHRSHDGTGQMRWQFARSPSLYAQPPTPDSVRSAFRLPHRPGQIPPAAEHVTEHRPNNNIYEQRARAAQDQPRDQAVQGIAPQQIERMPEA